LRVPRAGLLRDALPATRPVLYILTVHL